MTTLGDINNHNDLVGLKNLKAKAANDPNDKQALKMAAQHFESIFMGMMLKSMRKANAVFEKDNPLHSNTSNFYRDMYDQQLTTDLAGKGSLGLADLIVEQLSNDGSRFTSADLLRNDGDLTRQTFKAKANELKEFQRMLNQEPLGPVDFDQALSSESQTLLNSMNSIIDKTFAQVGGDKLPDSLLANRTDSEVIDSARKKQTVGFDSPDDFITQIWQFAKKASSKIGLNPAVMVAQSALETGWGKHIIEDNNGESSFNLFNVKAHRDWQGEKAAHSTLEFEQGLPVKKVEPFRVYNSFSESFDDFVSFLKGNNRYQDALDSTNKPETFLKNLQQAGYATDPNYADKIIKILNSDKFKNVIGTLESTVDNKRGA